MKPLYLMLFLTGTTFSSLAVTLGPQTTGTGELVVNANGITTHTLTTVTGLQNGPINDQTLIANGTYTYSLAGSFLYLGYTGIQAASPNVVINGNPLNAYVYGSQTNSPLRYKIVGGQSSYGVDNGWFIQFTNCALNTCPSFSYNVYTDGAQNLVADTYKIYITVVGYSP